MVQVQVCIVGGPLKKLQGETVADIRSQLGLGDNYQATQNNEPADNGDSLETNAFLTFTPAVKGGC